MHRIATTSCKRFQCGRDHFTTKQAGLAGHPFVTGWGSPDLPNVVANSSDKFVRIPGDLKGHGVAVHPKTGDIYVADSDNGRVLKLSR